MEPYTSEALASDMPAVEPARRVSPMVAVWGLLGTLAVVYLGLLIARPEMLSQYLPTVAPIGAPETNEGQRANALAAAQELRDKVNQLEGDVQSLKNDIAEKTDSLSLKTVGLDDRLTAIEMAKIAVAQPEPAKKGKSTAAIPQPVPVTQIAKPAAPIAPAPATAPVAAAPAVPATPPAAAAQPPKKAVAAPVTAAAKPVAPAAAPAPAPVNAAASIAPPFAVESVPGVKLLNSIPPPALPVAPAAAGEATAQPVPAPQAAAPLTTGSVDPNAQGQRVAKAVGVYIGSGPTLDAVRSSWTLLSTRNADTLAGLQPRYVSSMDAQGMAYGLVAGPLKTTAEAQRVCKDLAAKAVNCRIGEFGGDAL